MPEATSTIQLAPDTEETPTRKPPRKQATAKPCPSFALDEALPYPDVPENYIGRHYVQLPADFEEKFGTLLVQASKELSLRGVQHGKKKMLWLEKKTICTQQTYDYWEVRAVLELSNMKDTETLATSICMLNGQQDHDLVVIGDCDPSEAVCFLTNIKQAWRINESAETFEEISADGIQCLAEVAWNGVATQP